MEDAVSPVLTPVYEITWTGKNITADIKPLVISIDYTDNLHGKADDLQIKLHDVDRLWKGEWRPGKGDKLTFAFGYAGEPLQYAGSFQCDAPAYDGPPDRVTIKAKSAGVTQGLKTPQHRAHENADLKGIATAMAARHGLALVGDIPAARYDRITQAGKGDLEFLKDLGEAHGCAVKIVGDKLVMTDLQGLRSGKAVMTIRRSDANIVKSYSFEDASEGTAKSSSVTYFDPKTGKQIKAVATDPGNKTGETIKPGARAESPAAAQNLADTQLREANVAQWSGELELLGEPRLCAGAKIEVIGWGVCDGLYLVEKASHKFSKGDGFTTSISIKAATLEGVKGKKKKKT